MDRNFHALAHFAKQILRTELDIGELEASVTSATAAHHVRHRNELITRSIDRYEERGKARVLVVFRIGSAIT